MKQRKDKGIPKKDITNMKFGKLTVIKFHHMSKHGSIWECKCECNKITYVRLTHLINNKTLSCGCLRKEMYKKWRKDKIGYKNTRWNGGKSINNGYITIINPDRFKENEPERIFEHRFIMEKYLGRKLNKDEIVHHKNCIKTDNRIENLELLTTNTHRGKVKCPYCQKHFLIK